DSTADLQGFEDAQEFSDVYPFVPYQYRLLQNVFEQIRKHGSSGKHLSEGERSMLSAYREAGIRFMEENEGTLIPFYAFYDTIREFLQPTVSRVIEGAAENPKLQDDPFNIELLKVLFMVKYVKELPANIDNIATLMVSHIDEDKLELKEKIKVSLRKLISQTLIQKNGEEYIFLTDDEQDVNREIKSVMVEEEKIKKQLAEYIFEDLYETKKYRYSKWYDFSFNQKMDEKNHGNQTASIGINILSPLSEHYHKSDQELMMMSSAENEVIIKLGGEESYVDELEEALRIEEYRRGRNIAQLPENIQNILNNKQVEVRDRRRRVRELLEEAIKNSTFFIKGTEVDIKGSTVRDKMDEAFKVLVENIYKHLPLIQEFTSQESDLKAFLVTDHDQITLDDAAMRNPNEQAKQMMDEFIRLQAELNKQIRIKPLYDRFGDVPYGWRELDMAHLIAELLKEQRIRIRYNAEYLEPRENANTLMTAFTRPKEADKAIVIVRQKVDESLLRSVKRIARDLFDKRDLADDEDGLIKGVRDLIEKKEEEIHNYKERYEGRKYPGMSLLNKGLEYFSQFDKGIDNLTFFTRFKDLEDDLADWFEDIQYVKSFFSSNQQNIYDNGLQAIAAYEEVKAYVQTEEVETAMNQLNDILNDPIPYGRIKDIPELVHILDEQINVVLTEKKKVAEEKIQLDSDEASLQAGQYGVSNLTKERIQTEYKNMLTLLKSYTDIFKVDAIITRSNSYKIKAIQDVQREITEWQRQKELEQKKRNDAQVTEPPTIEPEPVIQKETVKLSELMTITTLSSEEDVDKYVNTLSNKLKQIIRSNKEIEFKK
ncbi:MAG TPA: BREX system P-loop protein BrxC, partial [Atopostipes sp.]|nr:BREX system P-loop protein BrxC [Atopostipes sp.]